MAKGPHDKLRRQSRLSAVQALYQMELSGQTVQQVTMEFLNHRFGYHGEPGMVAADEEFFEDLVRGVIDNQIDIDKMISDNLSSNWKLSRIEKTLRAILRAGSYEILRRPDVPALVIIDQYVGLSAEFHDENQIGFINRVLENMAKSIRKAEFGLTGAS